MINDFETHVLGRLTKLERQNRRLKWSVSCLLLLTLGLVAAGLLLHTPAGRRLQRYRTVEAGEFILRDERGTVRAQLKVDTLTGLTLFGPEGQLSAGMWENLGRGSSVVLLSDGNRQPGLSLGAWEDGSAMSIHDRHGKKRAELIATNGEHGLRFFDAKGQALLRGP